MGTPGWLSQKSLELDLRVMSLSLMLGVEILNKYVKLKLKG